ncbi:MAG: hypothetical protein A2722_01300 [Candidatus Doudnabacteria bacterium RIFCSPHIGHO2_01_FULL_50_11]|uniref:Pyridoxamine 5'-phosphate oxidase N-terminal domain-containing protein n=1 Tax=Candidatus Doudnabacteria bacterium RIFCSPHIGHO2_01_FULL_50_11 TaxID=1817828 RepID=A0A1F5PHT9_9BACT|nr:MAG: hypothetical protein A2722_01300 [Candidatus Doudnabacteria bacterium RIFCSPHIGHO2_01_FULL_50_11]HLC44972.1 pyridoxamine 5'-phosphate oxidase family protein [Patescibacteria group bacterium]
MTHQHKVKRIHDFIKSHHLATISTVTGDALPQAAVVGFAMIDGEIVFGTYQGSRKFRNLQSNPRVALVIGMDRGETVQYEGMATELSGHELARFKQEYLSQVPTAAKYVPQAEQVFFKIKPAYVRYVNISQDPWEQIEVNF